MKKLSIVTASEMQAMDAIAIEKYEIPGIILMENAGKECVRVFEEMHFSPEGLNVAVFAGKGNNGGDGFVIARHLQNRGAHVSIVLLGKIDQLKGDASINARIAKNMDIPILEAPRDGSRHVFDDALHDADLVIDAIFGTGLTRAPEGIYRSAIEAINDSSAFVLSVDIPSGLLADEPYIPGTSVEADLTVTFGLPKPALVLYPSAAQVGQLVVVDISIPDAVLDASPSKGSFIHPFDFLDIQIPRAPDAHKGDFGHLLIIAGSPGKTGAAALAGQAALRTGAGLVTVAVPEKLNAILETKLTEVMTIPVPGLHGKIFSSESLPAIIENLPRKSAVLIGPGIGTAEETAGFIKELLPHIDCPVVMDADGLNIMADVEPPWPGSDHPVILTPHPGEMARLLGETTSRTLSHQLSLVPQYAEKGNFLIAFKTARTLAVFPDGSWKVNITGNPGLASGGSGDVLSGFIAGYLAQRYTPETALEAGIFLHGLCADIATDEIDEPELIAGDILKHLSQARRIALENNTAFSGRFVPYMLQREPL